MLDRSFQAGKIFVVAILLGVAVQSVSAQNGSALRGIADAGRLPDLRWPDFSDYRLHVQHFYEPSGYVSAWVHAGQPTQQALGVIGILQQAANKGLNADDYDGSLWPARLAQLHGSPSPTDSDVARFDAALTVCVMRYISDLHIGKVNPKYFKFGLDIEHKKYNLPDFLRQRLIDAPDVKAILEEVEPPSRDTNAPRKPCSDMSSWRGRMTENNCLSPQRRLDREAPMLAFRA